MTTTDNRPNTAPEAPDGVAATPETLGWRYVGDVSIKVCSPCQTMCNATVSACPLCGSTEFRRVIPDATP